MPSFMSSFRRESGNGKAVLSTHSSASHRTVSSVSSSNSSKSVPLHILCEQCRRFAKECSALDWLQRPRREPTSSWSVWRFCTVVQLSQSAMSCHCCRMIFASLQWKTRRSKRPTGDVGLEFRLEIEEGDLHLMVNTEEGKRETGYASHVASFRLQTYDYTKLGAFDSHITAKEAPLLASDNIRKAKQWLQTCLGEHTACRKFHTSTVDDPQRRPTRVLEITPNAIRLRCNMQNERFDYLVLSYMWGTNHTQQLRLLQSNLNAFQEEIPRTEFEASDVYKEAIRVTLALGYKYLWIDSLTIIQDSPEDWAHEARRMAIVYGNATANLAFLFPPHSPTKPTQRDDPRVWNPCILRASSSQAPGIYMEHINSVLRQDYNVEDTRDWLVQRDWPLFNRAWTFQEYLLAPRTLLLGAKNLMWQCSDGFYDELLGPIAPTQPTTPQDPKHGKDRGKSRYFPENICEMANYGRTGSLSEPAVISFMIDYQNLIDEYRSRKLSFGKDRIVAFAGIARALSNLGQLTYLAGLWEDILPIALLWFVDKKAKYLVRLQDGLPNGEEVPASVWTPEIEEPVAQPGLPSWSWFAAPIWRYYQLFPLFRYSELLVRCKSYSSPRLVCWDDIFWAEGRGFRFAGQAPGRVPEGGLFDFSGLQVTLATLVLPVRADWPGDLAKQMGRLKQTTAAGSSESGFLYWEPVLEYYPDDPAGRVSPPRNAVYAIMAEFQVVRTAGKNNVQRRLAGLMLVPGSGDGTWRRVGVWKLRINVVGVDVSGENIAEVAKRWREMDVVSSKWQYVLVTLV